MAVAAPWKNRFWMVRACASPARAFSKSDTAGHVALAFPLAGDAGSRGQHFKAAGLAAGAQLSMQTHRQVTDLAGRPGHSPDEHAVADKPGGQARPEVEVGAGLMVGFRPSVRRWWAPTAAALTSFSTWTLSPSSRCASEPSSRLATPTFTAFDTCPGGGIHRPRDPDAHGFHGIACQDLRAASSSMTSKRVRSSSWFPLAGGAAQRVQDMVVPVDGDGFRFRSADVHADPHGRPGRLSLGA